MAKRVRYKRVIALLFGIAAILLLVVNGILVWAMTGPRSLDFMTPYIESSLFPPGGDYKVEIHSPMLYWSGWKHPLGVRTQRVEVMEKSGRVVASFSGIFLRLSLPHLIVGVVQPTVVKIHRPYVGLFQNEDGSLALSVGEQETPPQAPTANGDGWLRDFMKVGFKTLEIDNALLNISNRNGVFLQSPNAQILLRRKLGGIEGNITIDLLYKNQTSRVDVDVSTPLGTHTLKADIVFTDISAGMLASVLPGEAWMQKIDMPVNGWASVVLAQDGAVDSAELQVEAGPGIIDMPGQLEKPLKLNHVKVHALASDRLHTYDIKEASADIGGTKIQYAGAIKRVGDDFSIHGTGQAQHLPTGDLRYFWPKTLSPMSRAWVTQNISKGTYRSATLKVAIEPGDLKLPSLPDKAIDAAIEIDDATVRYLPRHPVVTGIHAVGKITGTTMTINATSGDYMTGTHVTRAKIFCPDLNAKDTRMLLDMAVEAQAKDVVMFLELPELNKAKQLNLTQDITGSATGSVKLDFIAFSDSPKSSGHFGYDVEAELHNVTQKRFLGNKDIANATGKVTLGNKGITYNGKAGFFGVPLEIALTSGYRKDDVTSYQVKGELPGEKLPAFGYHGIDCIKGPIGLSADFRDKGEAQTVKAVLVLDKAAVDEKDIGWKKPVGEASTLTLETESGEAGVTHIRHFSVKGSGMNAAGTAEVGADKSLSQIVSDSVVFGKNNVAVRYTKDAQGTSIVLRGASLDMTPYIGTGTHYSSSKLTAMTLDAQVDKLYVLEDRYLQKVKATALCDASHCQSADITGVLKSDKPLVFRILSKNGQRVLDVSVKDAGEFIRALGIFDNLQGGELSITGTFDDTKPDHPLQGVMIITEHRISNAPVLAKILTIASLTGIFENLSGKGLDFKRMRVPFTFANDVITLKEAKDYGPSLGVTADGTIAMKNTQLNIQGVIIPAYALNTILGNIPIIGAIAGGKNGGLVAVSYSVKGPYTDPEVSVNPLSLLTPGFLRHVFDIFDRPASDAAPPKKGRKPVGGE